MWVCSSMCAYVHSHVHKRYTKHTYVNETEIETKNNERSVETWLNKIYFGVGMGEEK